MEFKDESSRRPERARSSSFRLNFVSVFILILGTMLGWYGAVVWQWGFGVGLAFTAIAIVLSASPKIVREWEKGVVLRFGKYHRLIGPGLYWIIPFIDRVAMWIDQRVITTSFTAEKTLTRDTVPVDVDAVLFWVVWDARKAALEVEDYWEAISWAAQTALRDIIGKTMLSDLLMGREKLDATLQTTIDARTEPWGITVQSVEIRDVVIPELLQDAMSRQAQAERERQARIILGEAEKQIASKFKQASETYRDNPVAFHLRAMNMLYESLKEKGALVIVPSTAVESMGIGSLAGLTALGEQFKKKTEA